MRFISVSLLVAVAAFAAWASWQPPQRSSPPRLVRGSFEAVEADRERWMVLTRPIVWKKAADSLKLRLEEGGFEPIVIQRREKVSLHAFDDERTFSQRNNAAQAVEEWKRRKVDASITIVDHGFGVSLGRYFMPEYAKRMEKTLNDAGRPYQYARRQMKIDVYRFTFPPANQQKAETLWRQVQATGLADPVLMTETRLKSMFNGELPLPE
ncbi:MAG: hypothetical protein R8K46_05465 [Mariprofundaceae bacterium]